MNANENKIDKNMQHAWKRADWYYDTYFRGKESLELDLKAMGKTDAEIMEEYITTAFWAGYLEGLDKGDNR